MKLGFLTDGNPADVAFASEVGYQTLELALFGDTPLFGDPAPFRDALAAANMPLAAVSIFGQDYFDADLGDERLVRLERVVKLASALDTKIVVFGTGRSCPSVPAALERFDAILGQIRAQGMMPAFYNCHWENMIDRPSAWAELPTDFNVKFDPSHPTQMGRDWRSELLATAGRLIHAHAKDVLQVDGKFIADPNPGLGDIRWESFFGILNHLEYDGAVCVEPHSAIYTGPRRHEFLRLSFDYLSRLIR